MNDSSISSSHYTKIDYNTLQKRIGKLHLKQRLNIQATHVAEILSFNRWHLYVENMVWLHHAIVWGLKLSFLLGRGRRNGLDIHLTHNVIRRVDLPRAFDGFRILHLSDLHLDGHQDLNAAILPLLDGLDFDICVMTGDYRFLTFGSYDVVLEKMEELVKSIKKPIYGILGNHDFIEMVGPFEEMGITMLLNESAEIARSNESIYVVGVDDAHYYEVANLEKAVTNIPEEAFSLLLCHTPDLYRKAHFLDFSLMLSGHTHGGQLCLPGGIAVITNASCPREYAKGAWQYHNLHGYTSRGTGSSGLFVRFNCPPEITIHTLYCA